jgi:hypothetical protein
LLGPLDTILMRNMDAYAKFKAWTGVIRFRFII